MLGSKEAIQMIVQTPTFYQKQKQTKKLFSCITFEYFPIIPTKDLCLCRYNDLQCAEPTYGITWSYAYDCVLCSKSNDTDSYSNETLQTTTTTVKPTTPTAPTPKPILPVQTGVKAQEEEQSSGLTIFFSLLVIGMYMSFASPPNICQTQFCFQ